MPSAPFTGPTPEARRYAIKQLAVRAGVQPDFLATWTIQVGPLDTVVTIASKRIRFPHALPEFWRQFPGRDIPVARLTWMAPPAAELAALVPDFVVPFADDTGPLFRGAGEAEIQCSVDLPAAALLTLCRFEEELVSKRDQHGRFPAAHSVAIRHEFVTRPIVDEYGLALEQALRRLLPAWTAAPRKLQVKLSHDIDQVGIPYRPRQAMGHALRRRRPLATTRDLLSPLTGMRPFYLDCVLGTVALSRKYALDSACYWKASRPGPNDSGYDPGHPQVLKVMRKLADQGVEQGVHPGYDTFGAPERLHEEVETLRHAIGQQRLGGRQHYLRWTPATWVHWEQCGLAYDSTVGFAERIGFRAGTCLPYQPWLLTENREARLLEIPLIVMDATLTGYMQLTEEQRVAQIADLIRRCELVGGVFTLLWHNDSLFDPECSATYPRLLQKLAGSPRFDWQNTVL